MNKPIFENEEEAVKFIESVYCACSERKGGVLNTIKNLRIEGYIKRSDLEIAKEEWEEIRVDNRIDFSGTYLRRLKIADNLINLQQNEIERLKNAN